MEHPWFRYFSLFFVDKTRAFVNFNLFMGVSEIPRMYLTQSPKHQVEYTHKQPTHPLKLLAMRTLNGNNSDTQPDAIHIVRISH